MHVFLFLGILDQGSGVLVVFDETPVDKTYESTLELIHEMGKVVDALYSKAKSFSEDYLCFKNFLLSRTL